MTSKKQSKQSVRLDVEARVREGVKAVLGGHPPGGDDRAPRGWLPGASPHQAWRAQSGSYTCNLVTPTGNIERLEVRLDREGEFVTELSERYKRVTGDFEEDCPFTLGEDRAHQEHADMPPDSLEKVAQTVPKPLSSRSIGYALDTTFWQIAVTSVPYLFPP